MRDLLMFGVGLGVGYWLFNKGGAGEIGLSSKMANAKEKAEIFIKSNFPDATPAKIQEEIDNIFE